MNQPKRTKASQDCNDTKFATLKKKKAAKLRQDYHSALNSLSFLATLERP